MADKQKKSSRHYDLDKPVTRSFDLAKDAGAEGTVVAPAGAAAASSGGNASPTNGTPMKPQRKIVTVLGIIFGALAVAAVWYYLAGNKSPQEGQITQKVVENQGRGNESQTTTPAEKTVQTVESGSTATGTPNVAIGHNETSVAGGESAQIGGPDQGESATQVSSPQQTGSGTQSVDAAGPTQSSKTTGATEPAETTKPVESAKPDENNSPSATSSSTSVAPVPMATSSNSVGFGLGKPIISEEEQKTLWEALDSQAKEVILGSYGTGMDRKEALGNLYDEVQAKVNDYYRAKYGY